MARLTRAKLNRYQRSTWRLARDIQKEWSKDRVGGLSAEIAFFALLGLFPAVIVFAALLSRLDSLISQSAADDSQEWLIGNVTDIVGADNTLRGNH